MLTEMNLGPQYPLPDPERLRRTIAKLADAVQALEEARGELPPTCTEARHRITQAIRTATRGIEDLGQP